MTGEKQFRLSKSRDRKWFGLRPPSFFILVISIVAVWAALSAAETPYTERDYMSERERRFHGAIAVVGRTYHLNIVNSSFPAILTLVMSSKDKALHLEIKPEVISIIIEELDWDNWATAGEIHSDKFGPGPIKKTP